MMISLLLVSGLLRQAGALTLQDGSIFAPPRDLAFDRIGPEDPEFGVFADSYFVDALSGAVVRSDVAFAPNRIELHSDSMTMSQAEWLRARFLPKTPLEKELTAQGTPLISDLRIRELKRTQVGSFRGTTIVCELRKGRDGRALTRTEVYVTKGKWLLNYNVTVSTAGVDPKGVIDGELLALRDRTVARIAGSFRFK